MDRYEFFHVHKHSFLGLATILTSFFASTAVPAFIPLVIHLSVLLFYAGPLLGSRRWQKTRIFALWLILSLTKAFHWFGPSLNALSTPFTSVLVLFIHEALTTSIGLFIVLVYTRSRTRIGSFALLFPALWVTSWWVLVKLSPIGYLSSWSPVIGFPAYNWLVPVFGSPIRDWLVAAWAVVVSEAAEAWYIGEQSPEETPLLIQVQPPSSDNLTATNFDTKETRSTSKGTLILALVLLALTVPRSDSFALPRPIFARDTTPLTVGCVLPQSRQGQQLTLDDFIHETKNMNSADIVLWPESAVSFDSEQEREKAFAIVRQNITSPSQYVGVSFEELYQDEESHGHRARSLRRNGLALVSRDSNTTHLTYFKRNLVAIAESYRLQKSDNLPPLAQIDLKMRKKEVSSPKVRPISVTGSICLDFAMPDAFVNFDILPSTPSSIQRPQLILAPGNTWDIAIGNAMWEQAKQRALELDSMVLWCDGGQGGVSGVAAPGQGINEVNQVGGGSWIRTVGLKYPSDDDRRTLYAILGGSGTTIGLFWIVVTGAGLGKRLLPLLPGFNVYATLTTLTRRLEQWRESRRGRVLGTAEPNLLLDA